MKRILFILLVIYNLVDAYQTWLLLSVGFYEWNPIVGFMINKFGFWCGIIGFKFSCLAVFGYIIMLHHNKLFKKESKPRYECSKCRTIHKGVRSKYLCVKCYEDFLKLQEKSRKRRKNEIHKTTQKD